jgi:hypothetical protein
MRWPAVHITSLAKVSNLRKAGRTTLVLVALLLLAAPAVGDDPVAGEAVEPPGDQDVSLTQSANGYDLSWWTVDGGGGMLSGGGYTLGGTAGQPDAAMWTGGGYTLAGGFWGGVAVEYHVYLPLVLRNF